LMGLSLMQLRVKIFSYSMIFKLKLYSNLGKVSGVMSYFEYQLLICS